MLWLDEKYLRAVSAQLDNFKQKKQHEYNFRCPLCGDSEKNRFKARGYVYAVRDRLMFKCHNCGVALPFAALLKKLSGKLYNEYTLEGMESERAPVENAPEAIVEAPAPVVAPIRSYAEVEALSDTTGAAGEVYRYCRDTRKLPESGIARLFATSKAHTWLEPLVGPEKAEKVADNLTYLIQPFRLPDGTWYGAQLRVLTRKEYLTFRWSHEPLKMFGLEAWNPNDLTYVVEGPIDSLFLPNCISPCGSDLLTGVQLLEDAHILPRSAPRVYVWDNEPKNPQVRQHVRTAISLNEPVVIWPRDYPKDINDMVRDGFDPLRIIQRRTFTGLEADIEFTKWTN